MMRVPHGTNAANRGNTHLSRVLVGPSFPNKAVPCSADHDVEVLKWLLQLNASHCFTFRATCSMTSHQLLALFPSTIVYLCIGWGSGSHSVILILMQSLLLHSVPEPAGRARSSPITA